MYIHVSKKGINISLHINLNVLRKFMILCWATLIAGLGRMRPTGPGSDSLAFNGHTVTPPNILTTFEMRCQIQEPFKVRDDYL